MAKTKKTTTSKKTTSKKSGSANESQKATKSPAANSTAKNTSDAATTTQTRKGNAKKKMAGETEVTIDRRRSDRRTKSEPVAVDRRKLERREKVTRRRQIDPTTCERDYSLEEVEFMSALDNYKRTSGRMFPTCSEILEVIRGLGYAKVSADQGDRQETAETPELETAGPSDSAASAEGVEDAMNDDALAAEELLV